VAVVAVAEVTVHMTIHQMPEVAEPVSMDLLQLLIPLT
jgi:hypothetical protein